MVVGERYKEVPDEVIQLALGFWGKEPVTDMDQQVRAKILDRRRATEWARWEQPQPSLAEIRREYGEHERYDRGRVMRVPQGNQRLSDNEDEQRDHDERLRAVACKSFVGRHQS